MAHLIRSHIGGVEVEVGDPKNIRTSLPGNKAGVFEKRRVFLNGRLMGSIEYARTRDGQYGWRVAGDRLTSPTYTQDGAISLLLGKDLAEALGTWPSNVVLGESRHRGGRNATPEQRRLGMR